MADADWVITLSRTIFVVIGYHRQGRSGRPILARATRFRNAAFDPCHLESRYDLRLQICVVRLAYMANAGVIIVTLGLSLPVAIEIIITLIELLKVPPIAIT